MNFTMFNTEGNKAWDNQTVQWVANPYLADWSDAAFRSGEIQTINGEAFRPVFVSGYFGTFACLPNGWPGVGPSPAPYKMKAFRAEDGAVWQPAGGRGNNYMKRVRRMPDGLHIEDIQLAGRQLGGPLQERGRPISLGSVMGGKKKGNPIFGRWYIDGDFVIMRDKPRRYRPGAFSLKRMARIWSRYDEIRK